MSEFEKKLVEKFKQKNISDSSIKFYIRNLQKLNDNKNINNFNFLKKYDTIIDKLKDKKPNTQRNYIISIVSSLSNSPTPEKALYDKYYKLMKNYNDTLKQKEQENQKSETQKENWTEWDNILGIYEELKNETYKLKGNLNKEDYNLLLKFLVLSLYVLLPPRRNKDYQNMNIIKGKEKQDDKINYLDLNNYEFIFNDYKTSKKYGQQKIKIDNPELKKNIDLYLKFYPNPEIKKKSFSLPFLVNFEGQKLDKINSITLLLNKIFGKKISSSMLRTIYLSNKYSEERKKQLKDAKDMGNSVNVQQSNYVKI
jgi:hypothetical protein